MNEAEYDELRTAGWRRPLTPAEEAELQAFLATHPGKRAEVEDDLALTHLLAELPSTPVSSNFTARVMAAVEQDSIVRPGRAAGIGDGWRRWVPRLGWSAALAALVILGVHFKQKKELEEGVEMIVQALPSAPEVVLADFEVIQEMSLVEVDEELWVALNQ